MYCWGLKEYRVPGGRGGMDITIWMNNEDMIDTRRDRIIKLNRGENQLSEVFVLNVHGIRKFSEKMKRQRQKKKKKKKAFFKKQIENEFYKTLKF